jgi:integrase
LVAAEPAFANGRFKFCRTASFGATRKIRCSISMAAFSGQEAAALRNAIHGRMQQYRNAALQQIRRVVFKQLRITNIFEQRHIGAITALAEHYAAAATAANTKLAYRKDLARFAAWGGKIPSTPAALRDYLSQHASTHKPSTLTRWLASISQAHLVQGLDSPCRRIEVRRTLRGIKRAHGAKQRRVAPALRDEVLAMVKAAPDNLAGVRNKALLLVGFAGALRRSELAKLGVKDVSFDVRGMILSLGRTKTDQSAEHDEIAIPFAKGGRMSGESAQDVADPVQHQARRYL